MVPSPKWACSGCGMCSSRAQSVRRHIGRFHPGGNVNVITFAEYLAGIQIGRYVPSPAPKFGHKRTSLDTITEEFQREIGRKLAEKLFSKSPVIQAGAVPEGRGTILYPSPKKVFGYRAYVCDKCLQYKLKTVYFSQSKDGLRTESIPQACSDASKSNPMIALDKKSYLEKAKRNLPSYLETIIRSVFSKPILVAQLVWSNPEKVVIRDLGDSSLSVPFSKSWEGVVGEHFALYDDASWASIAISKGLVELSDDDVIEVAKLLKKGTFGFIRMFMGVDPKVYGEVPGAIADYFIYVIEGSGLLYRL